MEPALPSQIFSGFTGFFLFIVVLMSLCINLAQWYVLYNLEFTTCECSKTWHRTALITLLILNLLMVIAIFAGWKPSPISGMLGMSIVVISFMYIEELKRSTCGCIDKNMEYALDILAYGSVVLWALSIIALALVMNTVFTHLATVDAMNHHAHSHNHSHSHSPIVSKKMGRSRSHSH
jgi:hypothetical protein